MIENETLQVRFDAESSPASRSCDKSTGSVFVSGRQVERQWWQVVTVAKVTDAHVR